tara:strand:- start:126 stop:827 length:702 start_codon:yes stop_codon:yes gene_type:complete
MRYYLFKSILFLIFTFSYPNLSFSDNDKKVTAIKLIHSSESSLKKLIQNAELSSLKEYLKNSRAIIIFPEIYEGGLIFGAKGGNGILLIRRSETEFSGPFYYSIGGLSFGLQVGFKSAQVVMTIMTNRGLNSILKERVKLGVDVDTALINSGVGFSAESTLRLADIYSFSDNAGLFVGGSLEGTYLQPRNDLNRIIHGNELSSDEILKNKSISKEISRLSSILNKTNDFKRIK